MKKTKSNSLVKNRAGTDVKLNSDGGGIHPIWVLFDRTHFAVARSRLLELAQFHLTKEQAQILYVLRFYGGSTNMTQIAAFTMRQRHSVSTLVDRMEKVGLVKKVKVPNKKGYKVIITNKGRERYQKVTIKSIEMIFDSLSAADRRKLQESLNMLQNKARNMLGLDHNPPFLNITND